MEQITPYNANDDEVSVQQYLKDLTEETTYILEKFDFSLTPIDLSDADKVIWQIMRFASPLVFEENDDEEQNTISSYEIINNYKSYQQSFKKFDITGEQFFSILRYFN